MRLVHKGCPFMVGRTEIAKAGRRNPVEVVAQQGLDQQLALVKAAATAVDDQDVGAPPPSAYSMSP